MLFLFSLEGGNYGLLYALCAWASYAFIPWPYGILLTVVIVIVALGTKGDLEELKFLLVGMPILIAAGIFVACFPALLLLFLAAMKP